VVVDSSVLVAILLSESGAEALLARLLQTDDLLLAAPSLVEVGMVLTHRLKGDAMAVLADFIEALGIEVIPFSSVHAQRALEAFGRFGKGRHPAALNLGDCMVYAVAHLGNQPVLFVGNDFAQTDVLQA
jgi:ribonuclease VapC